MNQSEYGTAAGPLEWSRSNQLPRVGDCENKTILIYRLACGWECVMIAVDLQEYYLCNHDQNGQLRGIISKWGYGGGGGYYTVEINVQMVKG